jgi:lysophospholipase L1-like esterase
LTNGFLPANKFPVLVSTSLGNQGLNLLYAQERGNSIVAGANSFAPTIWDGNVTTGVEHVLSGYHVLAFVLGTCGSSLDHIYIDGVESGTYDVQGCSGGLQTSGNLFLGSSDAGNFTSSGFSGTFYRFVTFSSSLPPSQIATITSTITAEVSSRGVAVSPVATPQSTATIFAIGDSITCGYSNGSCPLTPWPSLLNLTNQPTYTISNYGIPSVFMSAILGSESNRIAPRCTSAAGRVIAIVFAGTNDLDFGLHQTTPATVMADLKSEIELLKTAGCEVFVGTTISRSGNSVDGTTMDAAKDAYDDLILADAVADGANAVIDFAANPLLGADGAYAGSAFQSDQTHPTQAGQQLLATAASNTLNFYYDSTTAHPTAVSAATYQMLSGDGAITLNGTSQALTAADCTGPTGATISIANSTTTSATIAGMANQPINGATTPVAIPAGATMTLTDVANPKATSGCHWTLQ